MDEQRLHETDDEAVIVAQLKEELSHASENGYDFDGWTFDQIALDLMAYSVTFEEWEDASLLASYVAKAKVS